MKTKHILLLIYDTRLESVISMLLRQAAYQVTSGAEADRIIKQISYHGRPDTDFDAAISCFEDSSIDEGKLISLLHAQYKPVPVLSIVPYGNVRKDIELLQGRGGTTILHSPFEPDELLVCMERMLVGTAEKRDR